MTIAAPFHPRDVNGIARCETILPIADCSDASSFERGLPRAIAQVIAVYSLKPYVPLYYDLPYDYVK